MSTVRWVVPSLDIILSRVTVWISLGFTNSTPAALAMIFSPIVIPMISPPPY